MEIQVIAHEKFELDQTTGSGSEALLIERPSYVLHQLTILHQFRDIIAYFPKF